MRKRERKRKKEKRRKEGKRKKGRKEEILTLLGSQQVLAIRKWEAGAGLFKNQNFQRTLFTD